MVDLFMSDDLVQAAGEAPINTYALYMSKLNAYQILGYRYHICRPGHDYHCDPIYAAKTYMQARRADGLGNIAIGGSLDYLQHQSVLITTQDDY